jgi:signal transduction histidine kinase
VSDSNSSPGEETAAFQQYESLLDSLADPIVVLNQQRAVVFANDAFRDLLSLDRPLVGSSVQSLADRGALSPTASTKAEQGLDKIWEGQPSRQTFTIEHSEGELLEVHLDSRQFGGSEYVVGQVRRTSEPQRETDVLKRQRKALFRVYEIEIRDDLSIEEKIQATLDVGCEFFDLPIGFLTSIDGSNHRVKNSIGSDQLSPGTDRPLEETYCRFIVQGEDPVVLQDARDELVADDPAYNKHGFRSYIGTKIPFGSHSYGTYCFSDTDSRDRPFTESDREFIQLLGLWAGHQIQRQFFEDVLREANELGRDMMLAETDRRIGQLLLDAVDQLFEMQTSVIFRCDVPSAPLRTLAQRPPDREIAEQTLRISTNEQTHRKSFENGNIRTFENLHSDPSESPRRSPIRSVVHVPIGDQGLVVAGSSKYDTLPDIYIESFQLLADFTRDAFIVRDRQKQLVKRGEALQRQNQRLEEFASLVVHDLRNPLNGATGFLEIARETNESAHFDRVEHSLERIQDLIDKLLGLARGTGDDLEPTDTSLEQVVRESWSYLDTGRAKLVVSGGLGWVYADETRLLQLFGNLIRNSLEHAGEDVTVEVGSHRNGFYFEDDGPGLPEEVRQDVLSFRQTGSGNRPGLGLDSLTDIVQAHDWRLDIPETKEGLRFEITTRSSSK